MQQSDLGKQFARGERPKHIPDASNVRVVLATETEGHDAFILSYGWAVIFGRLTNGDVVEFGGWQGYSPSTSTQMGKIRRGIRNATGDEPAVKTEQPIHTATSSTHHRTQRVGGPRYG